MMYEQLLGGHVPNEPSCMELQVPGRVQLHWTLVRTILHQTRWKLCSPALKDIITNLLQYGG